MSTTHAAVRTYDEFELVVLQVHLDFYRSVPEATSLTSFHVIHLGEFEKACRRLEERGMMNVTPYAGESLYDYAYEGDPLFDELYHGKYEANYFKGKLRIKYVNEVRPPGVRGSLTANSLQEILRLFKAGILKRNDV